MTPINSHIPAPPPLPHFHNKPIETKQRKYDLSDFRIISIYTLEWIEKARKQQVKIEKQIYSLVCSALNSPPIIDLERGHVNELVLNYHMTIRSIMTHQIIRKVTKYNIMQGTKELRDDPKLKNKLSLINAAERILLGLLPPKWRLTSPEETERLCANIEILLDQERNKIHKYNLRT